MAIKRGGRVGQMAGDATEVACKARWVYGQQGVGLGHFDGKKEPYWPCSPWWRWDGTEGVHWPLERISENCPIAPGHYRCRFCRMSDDIDNYSGGCFLHTISYLVESAGE